MAAVSLDRVKGALWGALIGDALAMPSHWYYGGQRQVYADYGEITEYMKPKEELSGSIMNKSSTGGGGRGTASGDIIGRVINHGKKHLWERGRQMHYHCTLEKGENTLEAQILRLCVRSISKCGGNFSAATFREDYVKFMTTPGSHNDAYASTYHRMFFANRENGLPLEKCPDNDSHNVDTIDGLILPCIGTGLSTLKSSQASNADYIRDMCTKCIAVTRRSRILPTFSTEITLALHRVVTGEMNLKESSEVCAKNLGVRGDLSRAARMPDQVTACYLDTSVPSLLTMCYKYDGKLEEGLLANANCGGENVHRGVLLGAFLGASVGEQQIPEKWKKGLRDYEKIAKEIDAFATALTEPSGALGA